MALPPLRLLRLQGLPSSSVIMEKSTVRTMRQGGYNTHKAARVPARTRLCNSVQIPNKPNHQSRRTSQRQYFSAAPHLASIRSPVVAMATGVPPHVVSEAVKKTGTEADQPQQPGVEEAMKVKPQFIRDDYKGSGKLAGKVALITGGDSGIGRAAAVHFAREGAAGVAIVHVGGAEGKDAEDTVRSVEAEGGKCVSIVADVGDPQACAHAVERTMQELGRLDILVNNAAQQHTKESILDITPEQLQRTFATNLFSMFYLVKAALPHLKSGSSIINSTSVTAYKGQPKLLDYSTTKGGIVSFTRSLSEQLVSKGIRVNAVAPGPIWTPLIPATFGEEAAGSFGKQAPMDRAGQPSEVATSYVFLASDIDSSYITGQVLHPNGGTVLNV